jgi:hypothetical protein
MEPCKAPRQEAVEACMGVFDKYKADLTESVK